MGHGRHTVRAERLEHLNVTDKYATEEYRQEYRETVAALLAGKPVDLLTYVEEIETMCQAEGGKGKISVQFRHHDTGMQWRAFTDFRKADTFGRWVEAWGWTPNHAVVALHYEVAIRPNSNAYKAVPLDLTV